MHKPAAPWCVRCFSWCEGGEHEGSPLSDEKTPSVVSYPLLYECDETVVVTFLLLYECDETVVVTYLLLYECDETVVVSYPLLYEQDEAVMN